MKVIHIVAAIIKKNIYSKERLWRVQRQVDGTLELTEHLASKWEGAKDIVDDELMDIDKKILNTQRNISKVVMFVLVFLKAVNLFMMMM